MDSRLKSMSIEEASDFWDTHSFADFPSHEVEIEYTPERPAPADPNAPAVVTETRPKRRINPAT